MSGSVLDTVTKTMAVRHHDGEVHDLSFEIVLCSGEHGRRVMPNGKVRSLCVASGPTERVPSWLSRPPLPWEQVDSAFHP